MAIVIIRQDNKIGAWKDALNTVAPHIKVYSYLEEHPKDSITMALVWKHPQGILPQYKNLKCIASAGAGVDFIFDDPELQKGLVVTRVIDPMLASDMSEFVTALIFNRLKRLNTYKVDQEHKQWNFNGQQRVKDVCVGILGMGALGSHLATTLNHIGFSVQGWANSPKNITNVHTFVGETDLNDFLATTSILVCLLPLTNTTTGILKATLFNALPKGAYVINVARGAHLVDEDLIYALDKGKLSGASLDVFYEEPLSVDHPFWEHSKVHITPHIASVSDPISVVPQIIDNYERLERNETLEHQVSVQKGY